MMPSNDILKWLLQQAPVVVVLGYFCYKFWQSYQKEVEYNKEQDRENLKHINELTNVLDKLAGFQKMSEEETKRLSENIAALKTTVNERTYKILDHLRKNSDGDGY